MCPRESINAVEKNRCWTFFQNKKTKSVSEMRVFVDLNHLLNKQQYIIKSQKIDEIVRPSFLDRFG